MKIAVRAVVVLLVVVGVCLYSVNGLKREVTLLVERTVPGLQSAAKASTLAADGYIRCLNLASSPVATNLDASLDTIRQITRQADECMEKYRDTISEKEDGINFTNVEHTRATYLRDRDHFLELLQTQHNGDAVDYLKATVAPAYNDYSQSLYRLFEHKVKRGDIRRHQVMFLSVLTPIIVGVLYVLLFILGLLVSFKIYEQ